MRICARTATEAGSSSTDRVWKIVRKDSTAIVTVADVAAARAGTNTKKLFCHTHRHLREIDCSLAMVGGPADGAE